MTETPDDRFATKVERSATAAAVRDGHTNSSTDDPMESNMNRFTRFAATAAALVLATGAAQADDFTVTSRSVADSRLQQAQYASSLGCTGGNLSPHIAWQGAPKGTKSFVITMYDPDAPTGSGWWHWVLANVPANVSEFKEGAPPPAGTLQVRGDGGEPGYLGACPPAGRTHRYVITVNALSVEKLELPPQVTPALLGFMTLGKSLGKASLTAIGGR
jgi:Raf kinase inhibitor-like YbhB/YbcL family protein